MHFAKKYCKIQHPIKGKILFNLYPFQEDTLRAFKDHRFNIIGKSRQMGISTLCAMDALHCMLFNSDYKILVIATKQDVARNLVEKVQLMHEFLPNFLKGTIVNDNKLSLVFANGSSIKAVSSSPDAGRSEALSKLIVDECIEFETTITIKNTETNTIADIQIGKLFDVLKYNDGTNDVVNNNIYEISTPSGWSTFAGIKKSVANTLFRIAFDDGTFIDCTANHQLKYPSDAFLEASQVIVGDTLFGDKTVVSTAYEIGEFQVFDAIDVELGNEYMTNGVVSHNCAHIDCMEEIWTSAQLTLATGGAAILLSSPQGVGNVFHTMWQKANEGSSESGLGRFNPISLPWNLHPDRDQAWRDLQDDQLGKLKAAQECDVEFLTSGHTVIDSELLEHYTKNSCKDPVERRGVEGNLWIWKYPQYNRDYLLSADVSRGDGEDYSTFHVLDVETMEQMAEYRAKVDTQIFGNILISVATEYNTALLVVDNRNIGWSTVQVIVNSGYTNLYYGHKHNDPYFDVNIHIRKNYDLTNKEDMVPGFTITPKNRPVMISMLDTYMREKSTKLYSRRLINELYVFKWIEGKPQAAKGYNDDLIMAFCMALFVRETALRMRQVGIELHKKTVSNIHRSVYKSKIGSNKSWEIQTGNNQTESLRWLL